MDVKDTITGINNKKAKQRIIIIHRRCQGTENRSSNQAFYFGFWIRLLLLKSIIGDMYVIDYKQYVWYLLYLLAWLSVVLNFDALKDGLVS